MGITDYKDPIIAQRRAGTVDDPYIDYSEQHQIINNKVVLTEIPDEFEKVLVSGENVNWVEIQDGNPTENQFIVDYTHGIVTFHPSRNNLTLTFNYKGTGASYFPISRVWTLEQGGNVVETLKDAEDIRENNEAIRQTNEQTRQNNENTRISNENTRISQENDRQTAINNLDHKGEYSDLVTYYPRNMVTFQNSTYICIQESTGNLPTDTNYWRLVAQSATMDGTTFNGDVTMQNANGIIFGGRFRIVYNTTSDSLDFEVI